MFIFAAKWWDTKNGPVFFYTGNEGDITDFWNASGFVHELAPQFGALIVFAEHVSITCLTLQPPTKQLILLSKQTSHKALNFKFYL